MNFPSPRSTYQLCPHNDQFVTFYGPHIRQCSFTAAQETLQRLLRHMRHVLRLRIIDTQFLETVRNVYCPFREIHRV